VRFDLRTFGARSHLGSALHKRKILATHPILTCNKCGSLHFCCRSYVKLLDGLKKISLLSEALLRPEARGICHICHMVNPALNIGSQFVSREHDLSETMSTVSINDDVVRVSSRAPPAAAAVLTAALVDNMSTRHLDNSQCSLYIPYVEIV